MEKPDYFEVTNEWLEAFRTPRGGYTFAQIKALGCDPKVQWKKPMIGQFITLAQKTAFEQGIYIYAKEKEHYKVTPREVSASENLVLGRNLTTDDIPLIVEAVLQRLKSRL